MIKFNMEVNFDEMGIKRRMDAAIKGTQSALDQQILKDSNYFIPMDTTELQNSGIRSSRIGQGHIEWNTPYARRLYYNPKYNFQKDKNPNARGLWFEEAKARHASEWEQLAKKTYGKYAD